MAEKDLQWSEDLSEESESEGSEEGGSEGAQLMSFWAQKRNQGTN